MKTNLEKHLTGFVGKGLDTVRDVFANTIASQVRLFLQCEKTGKLNEDYVLPPDLPKEAKVLYTIKMASGLLHLGKHPVLVKFGESFASELMDSDLDKLHPNTDTLDKIANVIDASAIGVNLSAMYQGVYHAQVHAFYLEYPKIVTNSLTKTHLAGLIGAHIVLMKLNDEWAIDFFEIYKHQRGLGMQFPTMERDGAPTNNVVINVPVKVFFEKVRHRSPTEFKFICLALIYLCSGEPDVEQKLFQLGNYNSRRARDADVQRNIDTPKLKTFLVSYNWMKPKEFHVDETWVKGHFRWQPCGKEWKEVKLIWIDAHKREFRSETTSQKS